MSSKWRAFAHAAVVALIAPPALAAGPTPGYPEAVVQWGVQKGETCEEIAKTVYGSAEHVGLLYRYNRVTCKPKTPLPEGTTLVLPAKVTTVPDAKLRSMHPDVRARPPGGGWNTAASGMPLYSNSSVNTLDSGRADIEFIDRTRVFLAPNTLVVIYGTAGQTRVSKTPPRAIIESGEVKAGLAALRGGSADVAVPGGGQIRAASRDTIVQRKGERTTVSVFDGKADVASGGKTVSVPTNFGTRFVGPKPPDPPRPLPPAPAWEEGGSGPITLAPGGTGTLRASWKPVDKAIGYRVELSRDAEFNDLVVREEVPKDRLSLRAEKMPEGTYYLRVRAIDDEEYLGIASTVRALRLVGVGFEGAKGALDDDSRSITVSPYGVLRLSPSPALELALDDGPFGPVPERLDLTRAAPRSLKLRARGGTTESISLQYTEPRATIEASPSPDGKSVTVEARFTGVEGVSVPERIAPTARVHLPGGVVSAALRPAEGGVYTAKLALPPSFKLPPASAATRARVDIIDGRGAALGSGEAELADKTPPEKPKAEPVIPTIGAKAPLWQISPAADVLWLSPSAVNMAVVSASARPFDGQLGVQGQVRASGAVGPLGLDIALRSNTSGAGPDNGSAWLGLRGRVLRLGLGRFELGPWLRLGLPTSTDGAPARLEPGLAAGGALGRFTWLANAGARLRLADDGGASGAPVTQGFLLAGGTFDPLPWLRLHALFDTHVVHRDDGSNDFLGGLSAGVEAGKTIFGAFALRASPLPDAGEGALSAQIAIGFRQGSP